MTMKGPPTEIVSLKMPRRYFDNDGGECDIKTFDTAFHLTETSKGAEYQVAYIIKSVTKDGHTWEKNEFVALIENGINVCSKDDDGLYKVAKGLKFSIIEHVKDFPVFYTKVVGVTFSDGNKSRQVTIQQLAAYKTISDNKYHVTIEKDKQHNSIDTMATKVLISVQVGDSFPLENKMVGFLPRQLPRMLTVLKEWYNINYITEMNNIKSNLIGNRPQAIPCSVALVLRPQVYVPTERISPQTRTLNMSGMNLSQIRKTLTQRNRNR